MTTEPIMSPHTFETLYKEAYEMAPSLLPKPNSEDPIKTIEALNALRIDWEFSCNYEGSATLKLNREASCGHLSLSDRPIYPINISISKGLYDN